MCRFIYCCTSPHQMQKLMPKRRQISAFFIRSRFYKRKTHPRLICLCTAAFYTILGFLQMCIVITLVSLSEISYKSNCTYRTLLSFFYNLKNVVILSNQQFIFV